MENNQQQIVIVNEQHMMQLGLEHGGFHLTSHQTDTRRFREMFGIDAKAASQCFHDLQTADMDEDYRIKKINPFYFLVTLYWAHGYGTTTKIAGAFKVSSEKTVRNHGWEYLSAIQALKETKVSDRMQSSLLLAHYRL